MYKALTAFLGVAMALSACKKTEQPKMAFISMRTFEEVQLLPEGGSAEISFTVNSDWDVSSSDRWVKVEPLNGSASGSGDVTVTVIYEANPTYDRRTAVITFRSAGNASASITLVQPGKAELKADVTEYAAEAEGCTLEVPVRASVDFTVSPEVAWIHHVRTKGLEEKTVVLSVDANIGNIDREGKVKLLQNGGGLSVMITIRQEKPMPKIPEGAVDLGLSVYWAECNLGAGRPEEIGNLYAWGETLPKAEYTPQNYKYYDENGKITKYNSYEDVVGFHAVVLDNLTVLLPEDDAATANLGGKWRMPTVEEWGELREKCTWEPFEKDGLEICKVTGPEGECIYLPQLPDYKYNPRAGGYWSSSEGLYNESIGYSVTVYHCYTAWLWYDDLRPSGKCVRGVIDK